ncbi:MAG: type II pantothenate kinase [Elusimicrobium sp.]|uniref:Type II pantothenate kinase n=1 Tax=Candidatus Avelusimicrobium gallicola TaxID=2562704 RepID=A0A928HIH2_9BACT|nr:type II pantothenate kinase [Elusimicrobium sp.]
MSVVIGIDVGGSTTKIVGYTSEGKLVSMLKVEAADPLTSAYGALGKFVNEKSLSLSDVKQIILTGVGSSLFQKEVYGIPTSAIDEFKAIGLGGLALSGKKEGLIVSMGTGTAFVRAGQNGIKHIGGSGVGGGTVLGLCGKLCGASSFKTVVELAETGSLKKVDLNIEDISKGVIATLPPDTTASNFGKMEDGSSCEDLTLGILNMVFQTIGMMAVFACRNDEVKDVILTGTLTQVPFAAQVFEALHKMHGVNFIIPQNAIYATATGAALSYLYPDGKN